MLFSIFDMGRSFQEDSALRIWNDPHRQAVGVETCAGLDGAGAGAAAAHDHAADEDNCDRADDRDDDRREVERAVDRLRVEHCAGDEAADEGAHDAEDDVADDTEPLVTLDEETGEIPGDGAEDDPGDDAHELLDLHPNWWPNAFVRCWGHCPCATSRRRLHGGAQLLQVPVTA